MSLILITIFGSAPSNGLSEVVQTISVSLCESMAHGLPSISTLTVDVELSERNLKSLSKFDP